MIITARIRGLVVLASVVAIAGCGSAGSRHTGRRLSSTSSASRARPTRSRDVRSAKQLVAGASAALKGAHGFTVRGSIVEGSLRAELTLIDASPNVVDLSMTLGKTSAQLVRVRGSSYFRANRTFWTAHVGPRAATLADRWIEVPPTSTRAFTASLGSLAPDTLARCLAEDHGTLSIAGETTIEHRRAILVKDAGNAPGSSPSVMAIAATGTPYPLAYTATAGQRAGGRIDVCNQGKANPAHGTITFDHFGHVAPITPPADPLRLAEPPNI